MTIDEAIKELQEFNSESFNAHFITFSQALQLGIEALKRLETIRGYTHYQWQELLPGETKD